jgi:hypothetical protein
MKRGKPVMRTISVVGLAAMLLQASLTPADIVKRVGPTVVVIRSAKASGEGTASGFIVESSGAIVTSLHVIEGARAVAVKLANGDVYDRITVRAFDARKDLAIIQVPGFNLPAAELADSDGVQAGQPVVLIGNPLGVLEGSASAGIVSGVRAIDGSGFRVIQTDAAANPGNSGGPLVDSAGRVIGVLSFKLRGSESLNFVIPINYVRGLLSSSPESLSLGELAKRLDSSKSDLFGASTVSFPSRWKSLTGGTSWIVRVEESRAYLEANMPPDRKNAGEFLLADLAKEGAKWVGKARQAGLCTLSRRQEVCSYEREIEITMLTPTRIEGSVMSATRTATFDCGKCQWSHQERVSFAWIPE